MFFFLLSNSKNKGRKNKNKERDDKGQTEEKDDSSSIGQKIQDERLVSKQKELSILSLIF